MKRASWMGALACAMIVLAGAGPKPAWAVLYSQSFDANDTANWKVNNNGAGTNAANFFFDYGTVGIPSAPHSNGGTTRGLKLGANLSSATAPAAGANPGISVSPLGKSFSGDYEVKFDWWSNYLGPLGASPASSTQLSTFGILSSGNTANYDGAVDGLVFAATGNGGSAEDFSAFSPERPDGYRWPIENPVLDHALYVAGSRNNTAATYTAAYPGGLAAPALQQANFAATQSGVTPAGTMGFNWHQVEIEKIGSRVVWRVDGSVLIYIDTADFTVPAGGANILFGHSDMDLTTSANANFAALEFTLIDNVQVLSLAGDYNQDGNVDEADYLVWKELYGDAGDSAADGNGDHIVDAADYTLWRNNVTPVDPDDVVIFDGGGSLAVPEPAALALCAQLAGLLLMAARRNR